MISWFGDEARSFRFEVVYSFRTIRFNILFLIELCGVQKQKGILVFSKSGDFFYIWHIVSSVAQRQNDVNFHKLVCS